MKRQTPYGDSNVDSYVASQMQHMSAQRMQQSAGMNNFPGRPDSFPTEKEHAYLSSKAEGQWQWDRDAQKVSNPMSSHIFNEENIKRQAPYADSNVSPDVASRMQHISVQNTGQGGNATRSFYQDQMPDPKLGSEKQANKEPRLQSHEQDMEIGYEDHPSPPTFEGLEQKFQDEIMKLTKEQSDAEDAENTRHREKVIEINTQYQEKLSSLRARQASRREEFLRKESQARVHQYQQAAMSHLPSNPDVYSGAAAAEAHRHYATGQLESYRERPQFLGTGRSQGTEARVPYPGGRVYNTGARYY